jgi:hypothetical protein
MTKYQTLFANLRTRLKTAMDHTWGYGKDFGAISYRGVYMTALYGGLCGAETAYRARVSRSVHDSLVWGTVWHRDSLQSESLEECTWQSCMGDCVAQGQLIERESSVPGYDVVSLGKYLPTLVRNFEDYLPSHTASHFSNNAVRTPHLSSQRITYCYNLANYMYAPHNDVSVNNGPHIRRWSHKIII